MDQPWNQKHAGWWYQTLIQSTKKKSLFELKKLLINIVKKRLDINHSIWPWQHVHWQALREVDWKLFIQLFSILNDCLLGTYGPRNCINLICSIYLPINHDPITHQPTSLSSLPTTIQYFNSFNFVWSHFNHRFFVLKNKQDCTLKEFSWLLIKVSYT